MQVWYVYIVRCADGSLYTGISTDLTRRLSQHNGELVGGARYTQARRPIILCWYEQQSDRSSASLREAQIKALSRTEKLALFKS